MDAVQPKAVAASAPANRNYFTAWRWHFYAGLYVIPFLLMLAVTGLIMMWMSALVGLNGESTRVPVSGTPLAVSVLESAAEASVPGGVATKYIAPLSPENVAVFKITAADASTTVLVNPYTAEVVNSFPWGKGLYQLANDIHGTLMIGTFGDRLIEIAASLGLVLVVTGIYLHWPRNGAGVASMLVPNLAAQGRALWKSLHGVSGFWMSALAVVFLISGLSWTGVWGEKVVQAWSTFPAEKWDAVPLSDEAHAKMNHDGMKEVPWTLEQTPMPESGSLAGTPAVAMPVTFEGVAGFAQSLGFDRRFQIDMPSGEQGVWTISHDSMSRDGNDPWADRALHIDQYTGNVLADVRYADYSAYAKMMAWGIAFHEGDMGVWNLALNTLFCLTMIFLPISGLVLWVKRRPEGATRLAAPPRPQGQPLWVGALAIIVVLGLMFPLAGAAMLAVVLLDAIVLRFVPPLRRALS